MSRAIQGYAFTVTGAYEFPWDMLRHDRCWPRHEMEMGDLAPNVRGARFRQERSIQLIGLNEPTDGRWLSFGWKVSGFDRISFNV